MDFFSKLRRLGVTVEREVADLQASIDRPRDQSSDGKPLLVLREIQKDVQNLKGDMLQTLESLRETKDFVTTVDHYVDLMEKKTREIDELEAYLSKYGYKPPPSAATRGQHNAESEKQSKAVGGDSDCDPELATNVCTPPPSENPAPARLSDSDTPRMEDFGISQETIERYASYASKPPNLQGFLVPAVPVAQAKIRHQSSDVSVQSSLGRRLQQWSSTDSIPDVFKHHGLCVTPGLMGGSAFPSSSPDNDDSSIPPLMTTPGARQIQRVTLKPVADAPPPVMNISDDDTSPVVPVFTTPGLKPLHKGAAAAAAGVSIPPLRYDENDGDDNTPVPPVFATPGLKPLHKPAKSPCLPVPQLTFDDAEDEDKSPVPPVLKTPGAKQVGRPTLTRPNCELDLHPDDDTGTPEPPQLSMNYGGLYATLMSSKPQSEVAAPVVPVTSSAQTLQDIPVADSTKVQADTVDTNTNLTLDFPKFTPRVEDDPATPEMPQLTGTYNFSLRDLSNFTAPVNMVKETVKPTNVVTPIQHRPNQASVRPKVPTIPVTHDDDDDDEMPQMPELTGTYNFSLYNKENLASTSVQGKISPPLANESPQNVVESRVRLLTEKEFLSQPDYMTRGLGLQTCNDALLQLAGLVDAKVKEFVRESDLRDVHHSKTKAFFLIMMRLGRMQMKESHGQRLYSFV